MSCFYGCDIHMSNEKAESYYCIHCMNEDETLGRGMRECITKNLHSVEFEIVVAGKCYHVTVSIDGPCEVPK